MRKGIFFDELKMFGRTYEVTRTSRPRITDPFEHHIRA